MTVGAWVPRRDAGVDEFPGEVDEAKSGGRRTLIPWLVVAHVPQRFLSEALGVTGSKRARAPKRPLPLNLRPLVGGYFFLLAAFLIGLALLVGFFAFEDFLAIMLLVFSVLAPLRHVSFPAEELSMATGVATVNPRLMPRPEHANRKGASGGHRGCLAI